MLVNDTHSTYRYMPKNRQSVFQKIGTIVNQFQLHQITVTLHVATVEKIEIMDMVMIHFRPSSPQPYVLWYRCSRSRTKT
jgi:hypothetical protein